MKKKLMGMLINSVASAKKIELREGRN